MYILMKYICTRYVCDVFYKKNTLKFLPQSMLKAKYCLWNLETDSHRETLMVFQKSKKTKVKSASSKPEYFLCGKEEQMKRDQYNVQLFVGVRLVTWVMWSWREEGTSLQCQEMRHVLLLLNWTTPKTTICPYWLYTIQCIPNWCLCDVCAVCSNTIIMIIVNIAMLLSFFFFSLFELLSRVDYFSLSEMQWWLCDLCVIHSSGILILSQDSQHSHQDEFYCPFPFSKEKSISLD